jgi:hypothetical protein
MTPIDQPMILSVDVLTNSRGLAGELFLLWDEHWHKNNKHHRTGIWPFHTRCNLPFRTSYI